MDKRYIILTGATGNIGNKLAYHLLSNRYNLILTSRKSEHLQEMKRLFSSFVGQVLFKQLDLSEKASIETFVLGLSDVHVSSLVNNAATDNIDSILDLKYDDIAKIININYVGNAYLTKLIINKNIKINEKLRVVNMSSLLSVFGADKSAAYSTSKAALEAFSRCVVAEFADKGIFCNTIRIAGISGELNICGSDTRVIKYDEPQSYNKKNSLNHIPENRFCKFEEINNLVEFLLSGKCDYINGQNINVDGGISVKYPGYSLDVIIRN